jgi:serine/threonine protein kinase
MFYKEVITWKNLRHPNVLPLLGVVMTENKFAMISEWMTNGNINQFVRARRDANRFQLVSALFELLIPPTDQGGGFDS